MNLPEPIPDWLVPGALVLLRHRDYFVPGLSGPYRKGTFNDPDAVLVVVELRRSPLYGGHLGVRVQTTGANRRYAGSGKWLGYALLVPVCRIS